VAADNHVSIQRQVSRYVIPVCLASNRIPRKFQSLTVSHMVLFTQMDKLCPVSEQEYLKQAYGIRTDVDPMMVLGIHSSL
jgi:hypothetical protein